MGLSPPREEIVMVTPLTDLPAVIQTMLGTSFYPHAVASSIELVQTHASYVLLTGDYAYKLKKPVNFGFLDYSTLAQRKHFIEAELRLNRRTAPELYLATVAITQTGDRFSLNGDGEPVEYALKMRQFAKGNLFSELLEHGQLTPELMIELAQQVAQFHLAAATNDEITRFGQVSQIRQAFDENYAQSLPYLGRGQTQRQLNETQAYTDRIFATWGDRFQARMDQGNIRECHGDLHLGNICLWKGQVRLFDCIEFNPAFRFVDVLEDLAFTVMDCDAQGRADLGTVLLNSYLEQTGDWAGVALLPLYLSRQAYVRAKVTSFRLDDPQLSPELRSPIQAKAAHYYKLAWQYTQPQQGQIILMCGLSGSGKSTIAHQLSQQMTRAIHIRSDALRKHLGNVPLQQRGEAALYSPAMTQNTYDRLLSLGIELARLGHRVILDAKYDRSALRAPVLAAAQAANLPAHILVCQAPLAVLRDRLRHRSGDVSDATVEILERQWAMAEPLSAIEQNQASYLDSTQTNEMILPQLIDLAGRQARQRSRGPRAVD
jgi:uncharacterized protein